MSIERESEPDTMKLVINGVEREVFITLNVAQKKQYIKDARTKKILEVRDIIGMYNTVTKQVESLESSFLHNMPCIIILK